MLYHILTRVLPFFFLAAVVVFVRLPAFLCLRLRAYFLVAVVAMAMMLVLLLVMLVVVVVMLVVAVSTMLKVPLIQAARLTVAGLSGNAENGDASSNELVKGISRSGR